jgi:hypothetical protein
MNVLIYLFLYSIKFSLIIFRKICCFIHFMYFFKLFFSIFFIVPNINLYKIIRLYFLVLHSFKLLFEDFETHKENHQTVTSNLLKNFEFQWLIIKAINQKKYFLMVPLLHLIFLSIIESFSQNQPSLKIYYLKIEFFLKIFTQLRFLIL